MQTSLGFKTLGILVLISLLISNLTFIVLDNNSISKSDVYTNEISGEETPTSNTADDSASFQEESKTRGARDSFFLSDNSKTFGFTLNGTGYPSTNEGYNFIAVGDVNGDSTQDMAFGAEDYGSPTTQGMYVYTNNGAGTWTGYTLSTQYSYAGVSIADCDSDGNQEVYAGYQNRWGGSSGGNKGVGAWEWTGSGFGTSGITSPLTTSSVGGIKVMNITGGSGLDMVVGKQSGGLDYYEGSGSSPISWTQRDTGLLSTSECTAVDAKDINKDGRPDILTGTYGSGMYIYTQNSGGTSWTSRTSSLPTGATSDRVVGLITGDVNNDGNEDIIYSKSTGTPKGLFLMLGNGGGGTGTDFKWTYLNNSWTSRPTTEHFQMALEDVDKDGDLDLLAARAGGGLHLYLGNGSDSPGNNFGWTEVTGRGLPTSMTFYGAAYIDVDNNSCLDVAGATWGSGIKVYRSNLTSNFDSTLPGAITTLKAIEATTNSIKVNWTAPSDNGSDTGSGPVVSYDLRYSTTSINLGNWASAIQAVGEPAPATPGTIQEFNITGLSSGTQYYIAIRSVDERPNLSPLSNIVINSTIGIIDNILPGQITDLSAFGPTNNSINLTWTAPADNGSDQGSGPVTEYDIRYYSASVTNGTWALATQIAQPPTPGSPGSTEWFNVTGLSPETTYYFAIKARDERPNWGYISNSAFETTLVNPDITPPAAISDLTASDPTTTTVNLTWTAPGDNGTAGTADMYDIRYATSSITDLNWASAVQCIGEPAPQAALSTENFQVTGLSPETTYYFAIKAADAKPLWSPLSNIATSTTLVEPDVTLPEAITDLVTSDATSTSLVLTWTAPGDDGDTGTVAGYEIRYQTTTISGANWDAATLCPDFPTPVAAGLSQQYTVTGLLSETTYYFAVKAYDEVPNYSPLSNIASGTTLASDDVIPPNAITDLGAVPASTNSIDLSWTAPGDDGNTGTATGYIIKYAQETITDLTWDSATEAPNSITPAPADSSESFTVTGLFADTKYYFAVKSFDEKPNLSGLSNIASARTLMSSDTVAPSGITDLAVAETTESSATLTWTAPGDDAENGTATAYDIRYAESAVTESNWITAQKAANPPVPRAAGLTETFIVKGLDPQTTYYFAIKSADEKPNWSPVSNSPKGTTLGIALPMVIVTITPERSDMNAKETLELIVKVETRLDNSPLESADVALSADNKDLVFTPASGTTGVDGTISVDITAPDVTEVSDITIFADVTKLGFKSNRSWIIIKVHPLGADQKFNLRVTEENVTLSQQTLREGENVTITAKIANVGERYATAFVVKVFVDEDQVGSDKQYTTLKMGGTVTLEVVWQAKAGTHKITVAILPYDIDLESDTSDNSAELSISVEQKPDETKDQPKGSDTDDKSGLSSSSLVLIIVVILIIAVLLGFIIARRKKKDEARTIEQFTAYPPGYQMQLPPADTFTQPPPEPAQPGYDQYQYQSPESQGVGTPPEEDTPGPQPPALSGGIPSVMGEVPTEQMLAEHADLGQLQHTKPVTPPPPPSGEEGAPPGYEGQQPPAPEQADTTPGQEMTACPTCANPIAFYATPCPHCGTDLNWG